MNIGMLRTIPLQNHEASAMQIGMFEVAVQCERAAFLASGDKMGFFKSRVASILANAIHTKQVPAEYWRLELDPEFARLMNLPLVLDFGA